jgi:membrane protease YdiL (CAAX protease family)
VQGPPTDTSLGAVSRAYLAGFLFQALVHCLMTNVWEELAWTNFVQDELQSRTTPTKAALITAPVFALQHAALVSDNSLTGAVLVMLALILLAVPFRMTMAWVFNRTGSTLLVGFTHACGNAVITGTATGAALVPMLYGRNFGPVHFFAFAVIGLVVAAVTRGRLGYAPVNLDGHAQKSSVGA